MPLAVLGDRVSFYHEFMVGCKELHGEEACKQSEQNRLSRIRTQPLAVVNYTVDGFANVRAPPVLFQMIQDFWNYNRQYPDTESWEAAVSYTYVRLVYLADVICSATQMKYSPFRQIPFRTSRNHWNATTDTIPIHNVSLRGGGQTFCLKIWDAAKDIISEWTRQELAYSSIYGIRIYKEHAVLAPHVGKCNVECFME
jgi:prolyl 4-hydroxylase